MNRPAVHHRRLIVTGGVTALGLATALALAAPSAAGAQTSTQGYHDKVTVIADHLSNPRGLALAPGGGLYLAEAGYVSNCSIAPASGMGPQLCQTGGQVVRIG